MTYIKIKKSIIEDRIKELDKGNYNSDLYKGDSKITNEIWNKSLKQEKELTEYEILQAILQQGEEYNENEAIEFCSWSHTSEVALEYKDKLVFGKINYNKISQELFKLYKDERKIH